MKKLFSGNFGESALKRFTHNLLTGGKSKPEPKTPLVLDERETREAVRKWFYGLLAEAKKAGEPPRVRTFKSADGQIINVMEPSTRETVRKMPKKILKIFNDRSVRLVENQEAQHATQ